MNLASLLAEIQQALPAHETSRVISALREDSIIWASLRDPELIQRAVLYCGENPARWNPCNISLLALSKPFDLGELSQELVGSLATRFGPMASEKYENYLQYPHAVTNIEDAGFLALAIRDKYQQQNTWEGLVENFISGINDSENYLPWQTPLTCVYGMIENSTGMLWSLLSTELSKEKLLLVSHILFSNPLEEENRNQIIFEMMDSLSIGQQVSWLKIINQKGYSKLVANLAKKKVNEDTSIEERINHEIDQISIDTGKGIKAISDLHQLANIYQYAGDYEKALKLLKRASEEMQLILAGMNLQTLQINPLDESAKNATEMIKNVIAHSPNANNIQSEIALVGGMDPDLKGIKKDLVKNWESPIAQIIQAGWLSEEGEKSQAQVIAKNAVASIIEHGKSNNLDLPGRNLLDWEPYHLIKLLVDLCLPQEALQLANIFLMNRPSDEKIINLTIGLLESLDDKDGAIDLAQVHRLLSPYDPDVVRQLANLWQNSGDWEKAFQQRGYLVNLLSQPGIEDWLDYARSAYNANEQHCALDGSLKILEKQPDHPEATSILGKTLSHLGKREEGEKYLKKAIILQPNDIENWLLLAEGQRQNGEIENCLETLYSGVKLNPEEVEFHRQIADVWVILKDWEKVLIHRSQVVNNVKLPKVSDWQALATSAFYTNNFHQAIEGSTKVLEADPENGTANSILGQSLYLSGEEEKSQNYLEQAINFDPKSVENRLFLADLLSRKGEDQRSLEILVLALNLFPENIDIHRAIAQIYETEGNWEDSLKHRREIINLNPQSNPDDMIAYAKSALKNNEPRESIDAISNLLANNPDNGQANLLMGQSLGCLGENDEAAHYLNKAMHISPEIPESWLTLAELQKRGGETKLSLETLRSAAQACPNSAQVNLALAEAILNLGLTSEALSFLRQASKMALESIDAAIRLGGALFSLGLLEEGRQWMKQARQKWPQNPDLAITHARILLASGLVEDALPALAMVLQTGKPDFETYLLYIRTLIGEQSPILITQTPELSKLLIAQQVLEKALAIQADHFLSGILMAEILAAKGEVVTAFNRYQQLVDHPESGKSEHYWRLLAGFGKVSLMMNEVETALAVLKEAAQAQPDNIVLQKLLAEAYSKADLVNDSFTIARGVLKLLPDNLENLIWFAGIAAKSGEIGAAEEALKCATELEPDRPENWLLMAELQQKSGENDDVKITLKSLLNIDHLTTDDWRKAAIIYTRLGDASAALSCLEQALGTVPQPSSQILFEMACLQKVLGDNETALYNLQMATEFSPDQYALHIYGADLLVGLNRHNEAIESLEKALSIREASDNEGLLELNNIYKTPLAIEVISEKWFSQSLSSQAGIHIRFAHILRQLGNLSLALYHAEKAVEQSPSSLAYYYLAADLALAFLQEERAKILLSSVEKVVSNDQSFREHYNEIYAALLGIKVEIALEERNESLAENILREGLPLFPSNLRLLSAKVRLLALRGEVREAEDAYKILERELKSDIVENLTGIVEDYEGYDLVNYWQRARNFWQAECLLDTKHWREALNLFEAIAVNAKAEAKSNLRYARALVICAENERLYQELRCVRHKPGIDIFEKLNREKLDNVLLTAWKVSSSKEVKRWEARGQVVFELTSQAIHTLDRESELIEDKAMITAALRQSGDHKAAIGIALMLPDTPENAVQQALSYYYEDTTMGLEAAQRGTQDRPNDPINHIALALLAEKLNQSNAALQAIEVALIIWGDEPEWHAWAGRLSEEAGEESGLFHWQQATSLNPLNVDYALELGRIFLKNQESGKAIEILDNASRINSEKVDIWMTLSAAYQMAGDLEEAFNSARQAINLAPTLPSPILKCGQVCLSMEKLDLAYQYARDTLTIDPKSVDALLLVTEVLIRKNKINEAYQVVELAPEEIKNEYKILLKKATLAHELKGTQDALPIINDLVEKYPDRPAALSLLAHVQVEYGDLKSGEEAAKISLKLQPEQPELNLLMGRLVKKSGQLDQAIQYLSEAILQDPLNLDAYQELGETYQERREFLQALRVYKQGIKALPGDYHLYFSAAIIMREIKDYIGAETMLRKASELAPQDLNIRRQLGAVIALNLVHNPQEASSNL